MKKFLFIIFCLILSTAFSQNILYNSAIRGVNHFVSMVDSNNVKSEDEITRIIVEFKDVPDVLLLPEFRKSGIKNHRSLQLAEDLSGISKKFNKSLNKSTSSKIIINKEFHKVFSGAQLEVPRKYLSYLSGLEYVKKIHIDNKVHIDLDESVPLIKADKVWNTFNNRGKGIKVSIIDTGIDYLHEALGQGFGAGYKVIGGYDFVNNDDDPMDDNGHGTHVAGIVAANSSTLKGVAPEASLVACKALDAQGNGYISTIIEAIEYSIDPNNDGDYSDAVDVINMSVGGYGTPEDPLATAVNNVSTIGVVVCAAAGNEGDLGFYKIGSPGCAEKAITVGSTTKAKILESYSSKGPNTSNFFIKPDVLAPGTNIKSCKLSGGTIVYSGTSMACPHVAGICALLKKQHPDWTPDIMKSAIKTTAEVLLYEPMEQGNGFVDAYKAITTGTIALPADLSFGRCDTTSSIWSPHKILKIKNISSTSQNYTVNISSKYSGVSFTVDKPTFSLVPNDSTAIDIRMSVNNSMVQFLNSGSNAYSAYAQIIGTKDTLSLPWAFVKRQMIQLKFEQPASIFILASNDKLFQPCNATYINLYTAELNVPNGNYDFMSGMAAGDTVYICIKKNLNLTGADVITISKNESTHEIHLNGKDEYGRNIANLPEYYYAIGLFDKQKFCHCLSFFRTWSHFFISDIPASHLLHCHQYNIEGDSLYRVISFEPVSNYASDIFFTNKPEDLVKQKVRLLYDNSAITPILSFGIDTWFKNDTGQTLRATDVGNVTALANNYWEGYVVRNEQTNNNPTFDFIMHALNSYPPNPWSYSFKSAPMRVKNKQFFMGPSNEITPDIFIEEDHTRPIIIGDDIVFGRAEYTVYPNSYQQSVYFTGQLGDNRSIEGQTHYYKIYDVNGQIIDSAKTEILDDIYTTWNGTYLKTQFYQVGHSRFASNSLAMLTSVIGKYGVDNAPPSLTSLQIRNSSGRPVDSIEKFENAQLRFSLKDPNLNEQSIKVAIKDFHGDTWTDYIPTKIAVHDSIGSLFTLQLDSIKCEFIKLLSLKISYADKKGNTGEWLLDPALKINGENVYAPPTVLFPINGSVSQRTDTLIFKWNPNSTATQYLFQLSGNRSFSSCIVNDSNVTDTTRKIIALAHQTKYFWRVSAYGAGRYGAFSAVDSFTTIVATPTVPLLVSPISQIDQPRKTIFIWNFSPSATKYHIQIASISDLDSIGGFKAVNVIFDSTTADTSTKLSTPLAATTNYFWHVSAIDTGGTSNYSATANFTTGLKLDAVDEHSGIPKEFALFQNFPNPFNPSTMIRYDLPKNSYVKITIYNILGQVVTNLVDGMQAANRYCVEWNASGLSSGIYFYRMIADGIRGEKFVSIKKLLLLR